MRTMKYKTKRQRCIAITDAYRQVFNVTMFTTDEVATWAISQGLWPVPKRGDAEDACEAWERRLANAKSKTPSIHETLDAIYEAGGKAWGDVDDPDKFIAEMRGE